jgi:hypothetical protein
MEDLSHLVPGLVPSSQAATNTVSSNQAMTAPGSTSESTAHETPGDPSLDVPAPYDGRHLVRGDRS